MPTASSPTVRPSTASRTVVGRSPPEWSSISVTKKALPPVTRCNQSASIARSAANSCTPSTLSGGSATTCAPPDRAMSASSDPQRMRDAHLVVARDTDHQQRTSVNPTQDEPQHVDGSLIGPVQIVDDEDRRCRRCRSASTASKMS